METTPVDEYLAREKAFKHRIAELDKSIRWWKRSTGLARHAARNKIRKARGALKGLEELKEMDSLPWEAGPTMEMDALSTYYLSQLR